MVSSPPSSRYGWLRNIVVLLAVWEVVGRLELVASGALPAPSAILARFWADKGDYPAHVMATLEASFLGFLIGNAIAVLAGMAFIRSPGRTGARRAFLCKCHAPAVDHAG